LDRIDSLYGQIRPVRTDYFPGTSIFCEVGYNEHNMLVRRAIASLVFLLLAGFMVSGASPAAGADDDFTLRITLNGEDISGDETVVIDPEETLVVDIRIVNGESAVNLNAISVEVIFAGFVIMTVSEPLANPYMAPSEVRSERMEIDVPDALGTGGRTLVTGIYQSRFSIDYTVNSVGEVWSRDKNLKIPGNPLTTPAGAAGVVVGIGAIASILALVKSAVTPAISAGTILPAGASLQAMPGLHEFALQKLESTTRGRVVGSVVNTAKKRIVKQKCPICESRIRHGHCYTCRKPVKEVRAEYLNMLKDLVVRGGQLIESGQASTVNELCSMLNVSGRVATDVVATLRHARLIKVKGITRKLAGRAVTMGICSGISAIIWITIGGFAALSTTALIAILAAVIVIPYVVAKSLQMKARHAIRRAGD
jgi:hypothetical protein